MVKVYYSYHRSPITDINESTFSVSDHFGNVEIRLKAVKSPSMWWYLFGACVGPLSIPMALGFRLGDLIITVAVFGLLLVRRFTVSSWLVIQIGLIVVVALALTASTFLGTLSFEFLHQPIRYGLVLVIPFLLFFQLSPLNILAIIRGYVISSVLLAIAGSGFYVLSYDLLTDNNWVSASRLSFWFNPNGYGTILGFTMIFSLFLSAISEKPLEKAFWASMLFLITPALMLTMSFGAIAFSILGVLLFTIGIFLFANVRNKIFSLVMILVFFIGLIVSPIFLAGMDLPSRFEDRILSVLEEGLDAGGQIGSAETRMEYNVLAFQAIYAEPWAPLVGFGLGSRDELGFYPHSTLILMILEGGIIAFLAWVGLILLWSVVITMRLRRSIPCPVKLLAFIMLFLWLVLNFRVPHMYQSFFYMPLIISLFLLINWRRYHNSVLIGRSVSL